MAGNHRRGGCAVQWPLCNSPEKTCQTTDRDIKKEAFIGLPQSRGESDCPADNLTTGADHRMIASAVVAILSAGPPAIGRVCARRVEGPGRAGSWSWQSGNLSETDSPPDELAGLLRSSDRIGVEIMNWSAPGVCPASNFQTPHGKPVALDRWPGVGAAGTSVANNRVMNPSCPSPAALPALDRAAGGMGVSVPLSQPAKARARLCVDAPATGRRPRPAAQVANAAFRGPASRVCHAQQQDAYRCIAPGGNPGRGAAW